MTNITVIQCFILTPFHNECQEITFAVKIKNISAWTYVRTHIYHLPPPITLHFAFAPGYDTINTTKGF